MHVGGRGDENRVNILGIHDVINAAHIRTLRGGNGCRRFREGIGNGNELGFRNGCNGTRMHLADTASAEQSESNAHG